MSKRTFKIWRGNANGGEFNQYDTDVDEGMVVLDVLHRIQALQANDLAIRWNCKAGKCGSCSMEINGRPRLACMTRSPAPRRRAGRLPGEARVSPCPAQHPVRSWGRVPLQGPASACSSGDRAPLS